MFFPGMTFLAENPEAFGFISDARPVATQDGSLIVTANGASGVGGMTALRSFDTFNGFEFLAAEG